VGAHCSERQAGLTTAKVAQCAHVDGWLTLSFC
jgi:hypothetical protein